jgi:hypothetical protein
VERVLERVGFRKGRIEGMSDTTEEITIVLEYKGKLYTYTEKFHSVEDTPVLLYR